MVKGSDELNVPAGRLLSLDFFRGFTMFLLIAEATHLFSLLINPVFDDTIISIIGTQFHHHPWNGMRFWDLVQPFFMFIVGVAIPYSVAKRIERGEDRTKLIKHAIQRALILLLLGWALYCIGPGRITFRFQNVLAQLSVTYLIAFLIMNRTVKTQIIISFALIGLSELAYRVFPVSGFNQPFIPDQNFGAYVDLLISGELSGGHWVSFNAIPTTAHTIWGVLAGKLLMSDRTSSQKIKILLLTGIAGILIGLALDPVTPIIKRISTSSFVILSGGWCLVVLVFSYWLIDVKKKQKWAFFFAIVGMNPLFIYLFAHVGGADLIAKIVKPFTLGLFAWMGEVPAMVMTALVVWFILWYMCFWLYKKKIFIRI
jgi:predicted acyltransferase